MNLVQFQEDAPASHAPPVVEAPQPVEAPPAPVAPTQTPHWMDQANPIIWSMTGVLIVVLGIYQVV
ncbi:MAG: hypothetical protein ACI8RZ_002801 [Myxococcota bacterium]|jgi:hypothetical protein